MLLPSGIYAWKTHEFETLGADDFQPVFRETAKIEFLLLGCGAHLLMPGSNILQAFESHDIGLEYMDTGAAVRTYNVLLAENRNVAAAIIAVENP